MPHGCRQDRRFGCRPPGEALELSPPIVPKSELERLEQIDPEVDEVGGSDEESRAVVEDVEDS